MDRGGPGGHSPWGRKELDMTERLRHILPGDSCIQHSPYIVPSPHTGPALRLRREAVALKKNNKNQKENQSTFKCSLLGNNIKT